MTFGSVCTGLGSDLLAWGALGWRAEWCCEVDSFCRAFLDQRHAGVPNVGDLNGVNFDELRRVDVVVGGTPCQSFSVNSRGRGLADPRGRLTLRFLRLVESLRPPWVVWENVPNALRSEAGGAFKQVLSFLADGGYGWAYRVLDLRGFGIPQRRRRLFLVAHLGGSAPAFASLFDQEANVPDQGQAAQVEEVGVAGTGGVAGDGRTRGTSAVPRTVSRTVPDGWSGDETPKREEGGVPTLKHSQGGEGTGWILGDGLLRKLSTLEYERLQGFPDGYTEVEYPPGSGRVATKRAREGALGNAFSPVILYWLGRRIEYLYRLGHAGDGCCRE